MRILLLVTLSLLLSRIAFGQPRRPHPPRPHLRATAPRAPREAFRRREFANRFTASFPGLFFLNGRGDKRTVDAGFAASLAAVYHPLGNRRRIDPSLGAGLIIGGFTRTISTVGYIPPPVTESWPLRGAFAQLSMHVNNRSALAFGVALRTGPLFRAGSRGDAFVESGVMIGLQY